MQSYAELRAGLGNVPAVLLTTGHFGAKDDPSAAAIHNSAISLNKVLHAAAAPKDILSIYHDHEVLLARQTCSEIQGSEPFTSSRKGSSSSNFVL